MFFYNVDEIICTFDIDILIYLFTYMYSKQMGIASKGT